MSGSRVSQESRGRGSPACVPALNQSVWQDWMATGRTREQRSDTPRLQALKFVAIAGLIAGAAVWSHLTPYDVVLRFIVAVAAFVVMFQAAQAKRYALAVVFAMLALLYNPVAPAFSYSDEWQRTLVAASVLPFAASLGWLKQQGGMP